MRRAAINFGNVFAEVMETLAIRISYQWKIFPEAAILSHLSYLIHGVSTSNIQAICPGEDAT